MEDAYASGTSTISGSDGTNSSCPDDMPVNNNERLRPYPDPFDNPKYQVVRVKDPESHSNCVVTFIFLAEGAANAVFQIRPYAGRVDAGFVLKDMNNTAVTHDHLLNKVLRISKGIPKTLPFRDILHGFEHVIRPLFKPASSSPGTELSKGTTNGLANGSIKAAPSYGEFLMEDEGVAFDVTIARHLHVEMHGEECASGICDKVPNMELRGMLLPDMTEVHGSSLMIEIKPKWLAQSPTAPRNSINCRTCALQARRASKGKQPVSYICPLHLASGNAAAISKYLRPRILAHFKTSSANPGISVDDANIDSLLARTTVYLATGPGHTLLQYLRKLQAEHDKAGVVQRPAKPSPSFDRDIRLAMTLRDCSLFIRVPYKEKGAGGAEIEAKLGDLDFKSIHKIGDWQAKEQTLRNGGWYTQVDKKSECAVAEAWKRDCPWYV